MEIDKVKSFGTYLRSIRESYHMTLKEVSDKIGTDISLLAKIERSERHPTKEFIKNVSILFQIKEEELLNEYLSDQIAYKVLDENADIKVLKAAESKIKYLKRNKI